MRRHRQREIREDDFSLTSQEVCAPAQTSGVKNLVSTRFFTLRIQSPCSFRTGRQELLVFLTASEDHRAEAFRHYASAYLIKPCSETELFRTMDHLLHLHKEKDEKKFVFVCDRREVGLRHDNILSVQAERNYVMITEVSGGTWRTRMSFSEAQQLLAQDSRFLTIIRGVIVNLDHVEQISGGVCRLTDGTSFPVSSLRLKEIQQVWSNYHFVKQRRDSLWNTEEE